VPPSHEAAVRAAVEHLRNIDVGEPLGALALAGEVARSLNALCQSAGLAVVYRPALLSSDWIVAADGPCAEVLRAGLPASAAPSVADPSKPWFHYDPLRPKPEDRNVVRRFEYDVLWPAARSFFDKLGRRLEQTRMVVCDGPVMLAWIGTLRPTGERVNPRVLRAVALGVRSRLRLALGIPRGVERATFEAMLDAYPGEAYVVRRGGRVEYASGLGATRLASSPRDLQREIAEAVAHPARPSGFELHPLRGRGLTSFFLVTRASVAPSDLEARLQHASSAWQLTPRHVAVLRRLALGDANKDIAVRLAISVRTVEAHLAAMMTLAKVESRLKLVARLWIGA